MLTDAEVPQRKRERLNFSYSWSWALVIGSYELPFSDSASLQHAVGTLVCDCPACRREFALCLRLCLESCNSLSADIEGGTLSRGSLKISRGIDAKACNGRDRQLGISKGSERGSRACLGP